MAWRALTPADAPGWQLWNADQSDGAYRANFYTPARPYMRKRYQITSMKLAGDAEARARADGYVTLPELDEAVIAFWAEADAQHLAGMVLAHLAAGEGASKDGES